MSNARPFSNARLNKAQQNRKLRWHESAFPAGISAIGDRRQGAMYFPQSRTQTAENGGYAWVYPTVKLRKPGRVERDLL